MKVEEFRTKAFRDKVEYIIKQRGHDNMWLNSINN